MKRIYFLGLLVAVLLTACSGGEVDQQGSSSVVTIYKSPTWGCCGDWSDYLEGNGFTVEEIETETLDAIKDQYNVPQELESCHTAIVDGYVIEGHVPVTEIQRLLSDRPQVLGIAVAGMPVGSPGMEIDGFDTEAYDVVTFDQSGDIEIYANYP